MLNFGALCRDMLRYCSFALIPAYTYEYMSLLIWNLENDGRDGWSYMLEEYSGVSSSMKVRHSVSFLGFVMRKSVIVTTLHSVNHTIDGSPVVKI